MTELICGSIIGAVVSLVVAELYHRRNAAAVKTQIERFQSLYDDLALLTMEAGDAAKEAGDAANKAHGKAHDAWMASVAGTSAEPGFPFK